jgi:hypothetical protein
LNLETQDFYETKRTAKKTGPQADHEEDNKCRPNSIFITGGATKSSKSPNINQKSTSTSLPICASDLVVFLVLAYSGAYSLLLAAVNVCLSCPLQLPSISFSSWLESSLY